MSPGERTISSIDMVVKTGFVQTEDEARCSSYNLYANKLTMDQEFKYKTWNHQISRGKHKDNSVRRHQYRQKHFGIDPRTLPNRGKNRQMLLYQAKKILYSKWSTQQRKLTGWEKIFENCTFAKGCFSKIFKELKKISNEANIWVKKWAKDMNREYFQGMKYS